MPKWFWFMALVGLAATLAGCKEDHPAECDLAARGDFVFSLDPKLPSGSDSTADIERTLSGAVLDTIMVAPNFIPPLITYRFHVPPNNSRLDVRLNDLLLDDEPDPTKRGFPVVKGQTYTLGFELTQRVVPPAMAIRILDAQGLLRFFGVNDWRPSETTGAQIFENGYGGLNADGELRVLYIDAGCQTQDVDFDCYQEYTNRRLDFVIGSQGPLGLYCGQEGTLGNWRVEVYKAAKIVAKAGCTEALLGQNGVSFTMERVGLR